jgi:Iap family predicted aminopeptidase
MLIPTPTPGVIFKALPDGAVLFSAANEVYFGLNNVAARVWEHLTSGVDSEEELCSRIAVDFPDATPAQIRADVVELLGQLATYELVAPRPANVAR